MRNTIGTLCAITLLCSATMFSQENSEEQRYLPSANLQSCNECCNECDRPNFSEDLELNQFESGISLFPENSPVAIQNLFKAQNQIFQTEHNGVFIPINLFGPWGTSVQLKDGSIWIVKNTDSYVLSNWTSDQIVVVSANDDSIFKFRLNNQSTNTSVAVMLHQYLNPVYHNVYNHRVIELDHYLQRVWLEDGSVWDLAWTDYSRKWVIGDTIIIGINTSTRASTMPNLLINCRLSQAARAHRIN